MVQHNLRGSMPGALQTHQNLVEEVLDELFLQRSRREEAVQVGAEKLGDYPTVKPRVPPISIASSFHSPTYISSRGEMKTSLRLITCCVVQRRCCSPEGGGGCERYIFMLQVLEQLQLSVGALGQDRCAEGLHNLLDRNRLSRKLILGRTVFSMSSELLPLPGALASPLLVVAYSPDEAERPHAHRL